MPRVQETPCRRSGATAPFLKRARLVRKTPWEYHELGDPNTFVFLSRQPLVEQLAARSLSCSTTAAPSVWLLCSMATSNALAQSAFAELSRATTHSRFRGHKPCPTDVHLGGGVLSLQLLTFLQRP